jgi:hypothetical protein
MSFSQRAATSFGPPSVVTVHAIASAFVPVYGLIYFFAAKRTAV